MKYLDFHVLVLALLSVIIFGFGYHSIIGLASTIGVLQFPIVVRHLLSSRKSWLAFMFNEFVVLFVCGIGFAIL